MPAQAVSWLRTGAAMTQRVSIIAGISGKG